MIDSQLPYRPNVCMLIFRDKKHIFLGEREGKPGHWQFPQGGVEAEFSLEENVIREAEEELGAPASLFKIEARLKHTYRYDYKTIPDYARGKFRGQDQSFWLVRFIGVDADINLERSHKEFENWRWASVAEVRTLAAPRRLPGYEGALVEFEEFFLKK